MIFPKFDNIDIIDEIREKYDPLAKLVRPHITIVFPFEMEITNDELSIILENRLRDIKSFEINYVYTLCNSDYYDIIYT